MKNFHTAMQAYEKAMKKTLGRRFHAPDITERHDKMANSAFAFLRATCWRWAAAATELCPELMQLPKVPSVGDAHAGNYALWRDDQARLVWGLSDYDEAARLPFALDLVRLCVSVKLAHARLRTAGICDAALAGYREGLAQPSPFILERDNLWLRDAFAADDTKRAHFWSELTSARKARPDATFVGLLRKALPRQAEKPGFARRVAGTGSLGRARYVALAQYRGGPLAFEAKASLPDCWPMGHKAGLAARMAAGPSRSPDPSLSYGPEAVVRRLAPNSSKIDFATVDPALRARLVSAMAHELASVHADMPNKNAKIARVLDSLDHGWLADATDRVARWTDAEYRAFRDSYLRSNQVLAQSRK